MNQGRWEEILAEGSRVTSIEEFPVHARILAGYAGALAAAKLGRAAESDYLRLLAQSLEASSPSLDASNSNSDLSAAWLGRLAYGHLYGTDELSVSPNLPKPVAELALEYLELCRDTEGDGALLMQNGEVLGKYYGRRLPDPNGPVELMSTSKSIVAIAAMMLVERGRLNLDEPVSSLFTRLRWVNWNLPARKLDPEAYAAWTQTPKAEITPRQLLMHESGLPRNGLNLTYQSSNEFMLVPLETNPGECFNYSNVGAEVLGIVLSVAAGRFLNEFIERELYAPLGIKSGRFSQSSEGFPFVAGTLRLGMQDLALLGEVVAGQGKVRGRYILSPDLVSEMLSPGALSMAAAAGTPPYETALASGMLWWRDVQHGIVQTLGYLHNDMLICRESGLIAVRLQAVPPSPRPGPDGKSFALQRAELLQRLSAQLSQ